MTTILIKLQLKICEDFTSKGKSPFAFRCGGL